MEGRGNWMEKFIPTTQSEVENFEREIGNSFGERTVLTRAKYGNLWYTQLIVDVSPTNCKM